MSPEEMDTYGSILESVVNAAVTDQQNEWAEADRAETQAEIARAKEQVEAEEERLAVWGDYPNTEGNPRLALDYLASPVLRTRLEQIVSKALVDGGYPIGGKSSSEEDFPLGKIDVPKGTGASDVWLTVLNDLAPRDVEIAMILANITGQNVSGEQTMGPAFFEGKPRTLTNTFGQGFIAKPDGTWEPA